MSGKEVLVFGAAGFIGTYLIDELLRLGYSVTASDVSDFGCEHYRDRGIPYVGVDITKESDFKLLEKKRYGAVVHLAACQPANVAERAYDPRDYVNVNVIGTLNILDFCRAVQAEKIIYASSHRNTQGLWAAQRPIREEDGRAIKYTGEYTMFSISESAAQDCVAHFHAQFGLRGIVLRLPPVYGYGPHTEIFKEGKAIKTGFQVFIENAIAGRPLEVWGDGNVGRDIVYVKDVVMALVRAIESGSATGLFNISSGRRLTLREQAETIADVFSKSPTRPSIIERPEKDNGMDSFVYDIEKARRELGWTPRYSFREMLVDYGLESESKRFEYLVVKRKKLLESE